jgi:hypothetical protein
MATNMKLEELKPSIRHEKKEYIVEREIKELKKELKAHIKEPISKAHPKK